MKPFFWAFLRFPHSWEKIGKYVKLGSLSSRVQPINKESFFWNTAKGWHPSVNWMGRTMRFHRAVLSCEMWATCCTRPIGSVQEISRGEGCPRQWWSCDTSQSRFSTLFYSLLRLRIDGVVQLVCISWIVSNWRWNAYQRQHRRHCQAHNTFIELMLSWEDCPTSDVCCQQSPFGHVSAHVTTRNEKTARSKSIRKTFQVGSCPCCTCPEYRYS